MGFKRIIQYQTLISQYPLSTRDLNKQGDDGWVLSGVIYQPSQWLFQLVFLRRRGTYHYYMWREGLRSRGPTRIHRSK